MFVDAFPNLEQGMSPVPPNAGTLVQQGSQLHEASSYESREYFILPDLGRRGENILVQADRTDQLVHTERTGTLGLHPEGEGAVNLQEQDVHRDGQTVTRDAIIS